MLLILACAESLGIPGWSSPLGYVSLSFDQSVLRDAKKKTRKKKKIAARTPGTRARGRLAPRISRGHFFSVGLFKFSLDGLSDSGATSYQVAQKLLEIVTQSFVEEDYVMTPKCVYVGLYGRTWKQQITSSHPPHVMSRIPFCFLSFLDFVVFVGCDFFDKRGYLASVVQAGHHRASKLIGSQHYKRLRRRIIIEFHSPSHFTFTTTQ